MSPTNWVTAVVVSPTSFKTLRPHDHCSTIHAHWLSSLTDPQVQNTINCNLIIDLIMIFFLNGVKSAKSVCDIISTPATKEAVFVVLCPRVSVFCLKSMFTLYGKPHLAWQYSWSRSTSCNKVLPPNGNSSICLDSWFQEHLQAHRYKSQLSIDVSYSVCVVEYDWINHGSVITYELERCLYGLSIVLE